MSGRAVLWRKRHKGQKWGEIPMMKWFAVAILVAVSVTCFKCPVEAGTLGFSSDGSNSCNKSWPTNGSAKVCMVLLTERSLIKDLPPNVESQSVRLNGRKLIYREQPAEIDPKLHFSLGEQRTIRMDWCRRSWECESIWLGVWKDIEIKNVVKFAGRRLAMVFQDEGYLSEPLFPIGAGNLCGSDGNVCPQLSAGGIISSPYEGTGGPPQKAGSYAQNDGENGNSSFGVEPNIRLAPTVREPFLPVFGLGAMTFLTSMFGSVYVYDRGRRRAGWRGRLLRSFAVLIVGLGSFSFVFGFPWTTFF
jgi:hypothetical protein